MLNNGPSINEDFIGTAQIPNNNNEQFTQTLAEHITDDDKEKYLSLTENLKKQLFEMVFKKLNTFIKNKFSQENLQCPVAVGMVAMVDPGSGECVITHAGNSEAVAVLLDSDGKAQVSDVLNKRHILSDKAEKDRLIEKGAEFHMGALGGVLYISRGFGGSQFSKQGFIIDPEVVFYKPKMNDDQSAYLVISSGTLLRGQTDQSSICKVIEVNHSQGLKQIASEMVDLSNIKFGKKIFAPNEPMTVQIIKISGYDKERPLQLSALFTGIKSEYIACLLRENFMSAFKDELNCLKKIEKCEVEKQKPALTFAFDGFEMSSAEHNSGQEKEIKVDIENPEAISPDNQAAQELELDIRDFEIVERVSPR